MNISQENLVQHGGPSHQTVRNIERGEAATYRPTTFLKLDRALQWPDGLSEKILEGTATDEEIESVVHTKPGGAFARGTALFGALEAEAQGVSSPPAPAEDEPRTGLTWEEREVRLSSLNPPVPTVVQVTDLIGRLAAARERTPAAEDALQALYRLLPELWSSERPT